MRTFRLICLARQARKAGAAFDSGLPLISAGFAGSALIVVRYGTAIDSHPTPLHVSATKTSDRISQRPSRFTHCAENRPPITTGPLIVP